MRWRSRLGAIEFIPASIRDSKLPSTPPTSVPSQLPSSKPLPTIIQRLIILAFPSCQVLLHPTMKLTPSVVTLFCIFHRSLMSLQMKERIYVLQDIICWKNLNEFASQSVPLQPPSAWQLDRLSKHVDFQVYLLFPRRRIHAKYKIDSWTICTNLPLFCLHMLRQLPFPYGKFPT